MIFVQVIVVPIANNILMDANIAWVLEAKKYFDASKEDPQIRMGEFNWTWLISQRIRHEERLAFSTFIRDKVLRDEQLLRLLLNMYNNRRCGTAGREPCGEEEFRKILLDCV